MLNLHVRRPFLVLFAGILTIAGVLADDGAKHQVSSDNYGVSGGNVNLRSRRFCCSATLGSLLTDGSPGGLYILSNNHVLARSGAAAAGEDISQPGLVDTGCLVSEVVADLSAAPSLGSNVDAAVAQLRPRAMNSNGFIEDIGTISRDVMTPAVGIEVQKSGRTTGRTTGSITAINVNAIIQYQQRCGTGRRFRVGYTDQVLIESTTFSAGGDSGSLIVSNVTGTMPQPVALLFAGSSTVTIGNPIGEVLSKVGTALGASVSFVGSADSSASTFAPSTLSTEQIARGTRAKEIHASRLMGDPAVIAVGVGEDLDHPGQAAVVVYAERGRARAAIARQLEGVPTRIVETDPVVAYGWNEALGGSCTARQ